MNERRGPMQRKEEKGKREEGGRRRMEGGLFFHVFFIGYLVCIEAAVAIS